MDAKTLGEFLNEYLDLMTDVVFETGGTLDKYIGDALMAFWGDPLELNDHGARACQAAVKMMKLVSEHHDHFLKKYGVDIKIGIGINSGNVSVGNMGSSKSLGYTVIGDAVNLASRLEGATKAYGVTILTTRETLDQIQKLSSELPAHRVIDLVKVKGKKNAVEVIEIFFEEKNSRGIWFFNEARGLYLKRQWKDAILKFQAATREFGNDEPSEIFIQRCEVYAVNPPPENWDGSHQMESK
jgi:adenylate cyclase